MRSRHYGHYEERKRASRARRAHGTIAVEDFRPALVVKALMSHGTADDAIGMPKTVPIDTARQAGHGHLVRGRVGTPPRPVTATR